MADDKPLSDNRIHDRLTAALEVLGSAKGETTRGQTAIEAARRALSVIAFGLLYAAEKDLDDVPGIRPREDGR